MSVGTLLSMPQAAGLFHRAIAQSGAGHHAISPGAAHRVGRALAEKLGVEATRQAIAAVPIDRLLQAQVELSSEVFNTPDPQRWGEVAANLMPFEPVIDGNVLTESPIKRIAAGSSANVEVIVGNTTEEQRLYMVPNGAIDAITDAILAGAVAAYGLPSEKALATYRAHRPGASAGDVLEAIATDWFYRMPAIRLAEARAEAAAPTYVYEFAWRSPQFQGRLGACHAVELGFVFDTVAYPDNAPLVGSTPTQALADTVHASWVAFASHGDPGWPRYDLQRRATMRFDTTSQVVDDPRAEERDLWEGIR